MQMHGAVRAIVDWLTADPSVTPSQPELDARLAEAWDAQKLGEHGYSEDYRRIAKQLIDFFVTARDGYVRALPAEMRFRVGNSEIVVRPDEVLTAMDGQRHIRQVRTGHASSKELETVAAAVFTLAAYQAFPGCTVEFVHLGDQTVSAVPMSERVLRNRRATAAEMIGKIGAGRFPRDESPRTCPRCPAFFICGAVPDGAFEKKFAT
jgi:hypothetical protein